jgi:hypothetical protein
MNALGRRLLSWPHGPLPTEIAYRDSLAKYLHCVLPHGSRIEREYRNVGTTVDIFVRAPLILSTVDVFIELKRRLRRKSEFDRLIGQIETLDPSTRNIFVVLVGDSDPALVARFNEKYRIYLDPLFPDPFSAVMGLAVLT